MHSQARAACEDYFYSRLDLTPSHELGGREEIVESLELMPEPMYRALEEDVGLVVDGEYDELRVASGDRLRVEDQHVYVNGKILNESYVVHDPGAGYDPLNYSFPPMGNQLYSSPVVVEWAQEIKKYVRGEEIIECACRLR